MNKTFKVVFNRARSGLMVANEITSSVQKKGTKTVLAVAALSLIAGSSLAAEYDISNVWQDAQPTLSNSDISYDRDDVDGAIGLEILAGASGKLENAAINLTANSGSGAHVLGIRNYGSDGVEFGGARLDVTVETNISGRGNQQATAMELTKDTVISADTVNLKATSSNSAGKSVYGIGIGQGGELKITSQQLNIEINTATERLADGAQNTYSETIGLDMHSQGTVDATALNELVITGRSTGETVTTNGRDGASSIHGLVFEGGTGNFGGSTKIDLSAVGGNAIGVKTTNYFYNTSYGETWGSATATLNNLEAKVHSEKAAAVGADISYTAGDVNTVLLAVNGNAKLTASSESGTAYGIRLSGNTTSKFLGDVEIDSSSNGQAFGVKQTGGILEIGSAGKTVSIKANGFNDEESGPTTKAVMLEEGGELTISGKTISIASSGRGLQASEPSVMEVGSRNGTELISIETDSMGVFALAQGTINMQAETINVVSKASGIGAIHAQNNNEDGTAPSDAASVKIDAGTLYVENTDANGAGFSAFSHGQLAVDADITVKATNVIDVRGNSKVSLNASGEHTTNLTGDIIFETPNEEGGAPHGSGRLINADVDVTLSGADSQWTGRSYWEYGNNDGTTTSGVGATNNSYHGEVTGFELNVAKGATWTLTGDSFVNKLTLSEGGHVDASQAAIFNAGEMTVSGEGNSLTLRADAAFNGTIAMEAGSELVTPLDTAFKDIVKQDDVVTGADARLTITGQGTLTINDSFTLMDTALGTLSGAYNTTGSGNSIALNFANATLKFADTTTEPFDLAADVTIGSVSGEKDINLLNHKLTIVGTNQISNIGTLNSGEGNLSIQENAIVNIDELTGVGHITVGNPEGAGGKLIINTLNMAGGRIFVDPLVDHSVLEINSLASDTLNTSIIAGNGALVTIGTGEAAARAALANVDGIDSARAVVFAGQAMTLGSAGSLFIDPTATAGTELTAQSVVIRTDGLLAVDQAAVGTSPVFADASSVVFDGGRLAIVNATAGTLDMGGALSGESIESSILTDNPFVVVSGTTGSTITLENSTTSAGLSTVVSMGIQSMIRRADMVLAESIADRTARDVDVTKGANLWVDVRGERYEQNRLGSGAGFRADIGYGAFGVEMAPTETTELGAAFQYGRGSLKGDVANVKNKTKDYSFTLYGGAKLADTGIKVVGELAYTKSKNDITSNFTALNQKVDATMLSAGLRAQKTYEVGAFDVTPSAGLRVSHIKTDAMKAGSLTIGEQKQTLVQVPLAVRVNTKAVQTNDGWMVTPKFKAAFVPTFGDKSIEVFGAKRTVIDMSPVQGSFGVSMEKGKVQVDAAANVGTGCHGAATVGAKVGLTYRF